MTRGGFIVVIMQIDMSIDISRFSSEILTVAMLRVYMKPGDMSQS
jgi:hypothetical protein